MTRCDFDVRSLVFIPNAVPEFFLSNGAKVISISSKDTAPSEKQLALGFSVFLPRLFAHLFTNVDNFERVSPPIETSGKRVKKPVWG